jgi:transcriptional regulator with XRE-family HTH domain
VDALHRRLAKRIRMLMAAKGLSVNRLADFSGVGRGRMSELLAGKSSPTVRTLGRIADALDVSVRDLFEDESQRP